MTTVYDQQRTGGPTMSRIYKEPTIPNRGRLRIAQARPINVESSSASYEERIDRARNDVERIESVRNDVEKVFSPEMKMFDDVKVSSKAGEDDQYMKKVGLVLFVSVVLYIVPLFFGGESIGPIDISDFDELSDVLNTMHSDLSNIRQNMNRQERLNRKYENKLKENAQSAKTLRDQIEENEKSAISKVAKIKKDRPSETVDPNLLKENILEQTMQTLYSSIQEHNEQYDQNVKEGVSSIKDELQAKFNEIIAEQGSLSGNLEDIIDNKLDMFSADRIGMKDYASLSNGGTILRGKFTSSIDPTLLQKGHGSFMKFLSYLLQPKIKSPTVVLQPSTEPGNCYPVPNGGQITIQLPEPIKVTHMTIDHTHPSLTTGDIPKNFVVWGWEETDGKLVQTELLREEFPSEKQYATFPIPHPDTYQHITLQLLSTHKASPYACIYRIRVHSE